MSALLSILSQEPASGSRTSIPFTTYFTFLMIAAALVAGGVVIATIFSIVRHRGQPAQEDPEPVFGNARLEKLWTVIPAIVVLGLFIYTLYIMRSGLPDGPTPGHKPEDLPDRQADIIVVGHQWWWEYQYPEAGVITANELHLPTGRPVLVELRAADVIHDFWVPQLGQKMDMVPGEGPNYIWLEASEPGEYGGACAEFCGTQHAWMRISAIAQPEEEYNAWLLAQAAPGIPPGDEVLQLGQRLFVERACGNCHYVGGTEAQGRAAPDLTHVASRLTLGAGVVENTPENLEAFVRNPHDLKPGVLMPNFRLTEEEVRAITAYLESLR